MNRNPSDNRIDNLRIATLHQNQQNVVARKCNPSGVKGVHWHKASQKWTAAIEHCGKKYHLGTFSDIADAKLAYQAGALFHHTANPSSGKQAI